MDLDGLGHALPILVGQRVVLEDHAGHLGPPFGVMASRRRCRAAGRRTGPTGPSGGSLRAAGRALHQGDCAGLLGHLLGVLHPVPVVVVEEGQTVLLEPQDERVVEEHVPGELQLHGANPDRRPNGLARGHLAGLAPQFLENLNHGLRASPWRILPRGAPNAPRIFSRSRADLAHALAGDPVALADLAQGHGVRRDRSRSFRMARSLSEAGFDGLQVLEQQARNLSLTRVSSTPGSGRAGGTGGWCRCRRPGGRSGTCRSWTAAGPSRRSRAR